MNLTCLRINPQTGALLPNCCKLTLSTKQSTLRLNEQQIKPTLPVGLQINQQKLYIYLNPALIVAVGADKLQYVCQALQKCKIAAVKVPERETQILAEEHESQGDCLVHCGTFDYLHDCFIVFRYGHTQMVEFRNDDDQVIVKCSIKQIGFDDQRQAIGTYEGVFYFWKLFSYIELKDRILQSLQQPQINQQAQQNHVHESNAQQKIVQQESIPQQQEIMKQNKAMKQEEIVQQNEMVQYKNNQNIQYSVPQASGMDEERQQQVNLIRMQVQKPVINELITEKNHIVQKSSPIQESADRIEQQYNKQQIYERDMPKTEQKAMKNVEQNQSTTAKKKPMVDEVEQGNMQMQYKYINNGHELFEVDTIIPARLNMYEVQRGAGIGAWRSQVPIEERSEKQNHECNDEMEDEQAQPSKEKEYKAGSPVSEEYIINKQSIVLCCQHECNVIDVQKNNNKHILKYHKFGEEADNLSRVVASFDIFVMEQRVGLLGFGQSWKINPTKLAYDVQTHSVYYNDPNMGYLYSCSVRQQCQFSYFTYLPVLDLARHRAQCILGLQSNSIFQFDSRGGKKHEIVAYKSVNNLSKLANIFDQNYYATAAGDGVVRTYDIRNQNKALNKFEMQPGITSLKISRGGKYIMCGYGDKAHILSCTDRLDQSVFHSRTRIANRRQATKLIGGHENLSHMQFIKGSDEGNVMALDDQDNSLVVKNIESPSILKRVRLNNADHKIGYLNSHDNWIVYGSHGNYHRHLFA